MARPNVDQDMQVAAAVLSQRYEQQLFHGACQGRVVPALVITGFLGAGKTTLMQHLMQACSWQLKLGVLVNEVAHLDVDSQLLNAQHSNAAAGIKAAALAGGCACCAVSGDLAAALQELAGSSNYQQLDYLLLETSGVADAEPLAAALSLAGFRLTAVVAVVDAEAGLEVLEQPVAVAQLCAADVVVLNKCDLASLGTVAAVEDRVQQLAPGVRMLRARFGQVPAEGLLDIELAPEEEQQPQPAGEDAASQPPGTAQGEIAFLSHEPLVSSGRRRTQQRAEPLVTRRAKRDSQQSPADTVSHNHSHRSHHHPHTAGAGSSHSHSSFGSVAFTADQPLCMACFQRYAADTLITAPGLFRAKGFLWLAQQRSQRYTFHLSGKQRAECGAEGAWVGPAGVQLVLIGQQQQELQRLQQGLQSCLAGSCSCSKLGSNCHQQEGREVAGTVYNAAAAAVAELIKQHHRFELMPLNQQQQQQQGGAACCPPTGLLQFSAIGSPLHGVVAEEVNAAVLRKANATPGLFLCHVKAPARLAAAAGGQQVAYQGVSCLQLCFTDGTGPEAAAALWVLLDAAVAAVLRKAYAYVHSCKCDVAEALQVMGK